MLGDLIQILKTQHPARMIPMGFDKAYSYRGDYSQLGVQRAENVFVGDMLKVLEGALNQTMQGYKGGDYKMHEYVDVYLVEERSACGEQIGPLFLKVLLGLPQSTSSGEST